MSMADRDGFIWYDGKLVPWRDATTHVLTHSLHYGLSVFEGVRAYDGELGTAIFRLQDHPAPVQLGAHLPDPHALRPGHGQRGAAPGRAREPAQVLLPAPLVFYGPEKMGVSPKGARVHVAIAAWPWGAYLGEEALSQGIRVKVSSFARQHVNVTMPRAKVATTYANSILANTEALQDGYDEALLLDTDGFVAEGSGENLFLVRTGALRAGNRLGPDRHHPLHHPCAGRRPGPARRDQAADPGRCLYRRRGLFTGTAAEVTRSARSTTARSAQAAGARHRSPAEGLLRRGAWPQPEVPSLAEQNLIRAALLISRQAASLPPTQPSHGSFISGIPMTAASRPPSPAHNTK